MTFKRVLIFSIGISLLGVSDQLYSPRKKSITLKSEKNAPVSGPYLGFFVCGGKLGFREISDQYSYKKQPSKIRHYVRKKTFSFPGGGNCPLRPPAMYGPESSRHKESAGEFSNQ